MKKILTATSMAALLLAAPAWAQQGSRAAPLDQQGRPLNTQGGELGTQGGQLGAQGGEMGTQGGGMATQGAQQTGQRIPRRDRLNAQDRQFMEQAAQADMAEVQLGQLATQRAQTEAVKEFGRWMMSAHSTANRELTTMVQMMHWPMPQDRLNAEAHSTMQRLQGMNGLQFDQAYVQAMVQDHEQDIQKFQKETQDGQDSMIKAFAKNMLPTLRDHLNEAKDLQNTMTGQAGVVGQTGVPRENGMTRQTGMTGVTGPAGVTRENGMAGQTGMTGLTGQAGVTRENGMAGQNGTAGTTGTTK